MYNPADNKIQGWMNPEELKFLYNTVIKRGKVQDHLIVLEIGCWKGRSTHALISALSTLTSYSILYCVDNWSKADHRETGEIRVEAKGEFYSNIYNLSIDTNYDHAIIQDLSSTAFYQFAVDTGLRPDIIFLDADHSYEAVKKDLKNYWDILKDGGIFLGHDYRAGETPTNGVRRAVNEKFKKSNVKLIKGGSIFQVNKPKKEEA